MGLYQLKWPLAASTDVVVVRLADSQFGAPADGKVPLGTAELDGVAAANEDLPVFPAQDLLRQAVLARYTIRYTKAGRRRQKSFILPSRGSVLVELQKLTSFDGGEVNSVTNVQGRRKPDV